MKSYSFKKLKTCSNPVTLQCTYYDQSGMTEFSRLLNLLFHYGFYGIELNLPDIKNLPTKELHSLLDFNQLRLTYVATGVFARNRGLSLSSTDAAIRKKSVEGCMENIRYASDFDAGVIVGYLKNHPEPEYSDSAQANAVLYLQDSLTQLNDFAKKQNVPILLEATNRYESWVANSLADTERMAALAGGCAAGDSMISILPDTFHMNIEESHPLEVLDIYQNCYRNIHLSDNNRFFPGLGCLAFENYLRKLEAIHYQGTFGIEGVIKYGIEKDLKLCVEYLSSIMESVAPTDERISKKGIVQAG